MEKIELLSVAVPLFVSVKETKGLARVPIFFSEAVPDVMANELLLPVVVVISLLTVMLPDPELMP